MNSLMGGEFRDQSVRLITANAKMLPLNEFINLTVIFTNLRLIWNTMELRRTYNSI